MSYKSKLSNLLPQPDEAKRLQVFVGGWSMEGALAFMGKLFKVKGGEKKKRKL